MVERSLILDAEDFRTGTAAGERFATGDAALDGCKSCDDAESWVTGGIRDRACFAV